ncbi:methyltransferase, TIGR04325 family [Azospirillum doebereinerae]|uniref:methyltransferase, TIGR04325 family n=1 Tax=Azospirillum doebereinerae TaxID=92933 RepID=UPI001EE60BD8|nr:methyltransferase, TIGR04325 family [Azospirillum doebereinerae]MCG5238738.1 methyltransferase, TIGR04325 family [Azospirillum doebereinerae]
MNRYSGNYKSIHDAMENCNKEAYEKMVTDLGRQVTDDFSSASQKNVKISETEAQIAMGIMSVSGSYSGGLRVLDFGGGSGVHYKRIMEICNNLQIDAWHVIEMPELVKAGNQHANGGALRFFESLDDADDNYHLILASGSLHYLDDPKGLFRKMSNIQHLKLIINRLPIMHPNNVKYTSDMYCIQNVGNPHNWQFPIRVCALNIWMEMLSETHEFRSFWDCQFDGAHPLPNGRTAISVGLLLDKKNNT